MALTAFLLAKSQLQVVKGQSKIMIISLTTNSDYIEDSIQVMNPYGTSQDSLIEAVLETVYSAGGNALNLITFPFVNRNGESKTGNLLINSSNLIFGIGSEEDKDSGTTTLYVKGIDSVRGKDYNTYIINQTPQQVFTALNVSLPSGGVPGAPLNSVQFNDVDFGGSPNFLYNKLLTKLTVYNAVSKEGNVLTKSIQIIADDGKSTSIVMPDGSATDIILNLPDDPGGLNYVLTTDGGGNLSWSSKRTIPGVPTFADDVAALGGGLSQGQLYKTTTGGSTFLKILP